MNARATRVCAWCDGPIAAGARRDAVTCSKRCRQARHRFLQALRPARQSTSRPVAPGHRDTSRSAADDTCAGGAGPRRLAYADPPYPGLAGYYRDHPDYAGEVDHAELISRLSTYDGWALSTSARALPDVLALCAELLPTRVRVAAWHRGHRPHTQALGPLNAWEPVIYLPAAPGRLMRSRLATGKPSHPPAVTTPDRPPPDTSSGTGATRHLGAAVQDDASRRDHNTTAIARPVVRTDSLVYAARPRTTDPRRVIGAKPAAFAGWMFRLIGAEPGDQLADLFPGSGGIGRAWAAYIGQPAAGHDGAGAVASDVEHDPSSEARHNPSHQLDATATTHTTCTTTRRTA